jgi:hypothetical protein
VEATGAGAAVVTESVATVVLVVVLVVSAVDEVDGDVVDPVVDGADDTTGARC